MVHPNYMDDRRYCPACREYVPYLLSIEVGFCVQCGGHVTLFSDSDMAEFQRDLRRPSRWNDELEPRDERPLPA